MSEGTITPEKYLPDTFFYSEFRNLSNAPQYLWWAGGNGKTIAPGSRFRVLGDPRAPDSLPRAYARAKCVARLVQEGVLEFCSSPSIILDNYAPDGKSILLQTGADGTPVLVEAPIENKTLPETVAPAPGAGQNPEGVVFDIYTNAADPWTAVIFDWSHSTVLFPDDRFELSITPPDNKTRKVKMGRDRIYSFETSELGLYKGSLTIRRGDGQRQTYEAEVTLDATGVAKPVYPVPESGTGG
jgi:hypothetical protein